jgi:hypothetical protein
MERRSFRWVDQLVQVDGGRAVPLGGGPIAHDPWKVNHALTVLQQQRDHQQD